VLSPNGNFSELEHVIMRSPWPRGLRIHPKNNPLAALPDSHPAKRLIIAHAECCRDCAGRDVSYAGRDSIDHEWDSKIAGRRMTFSGFMYEHLCFTLVLESWLEQPSVRDEMARDHLPRLRGLLDECQHAATADQNHKIIEMVNQVRGYLDLLEETIQTLGDRDIADIL
jgi:hypothetical protein